MDENQETWASLFSCGNTTTEQEMEFKVLEIGKEENL